MDMVYDLVIVGSGPAGLGAAIYAQRADMKTLVIEKEMVSGGQVLTTYEVDNYAGLPGINGFDLGIKFREHAEKLGAAFATDEVRGIAKKTADEPDTGNGDILKAAELEPSLFQIDGEKETYLTRAVIIASGANHRKLGVPGEEAFTGKGVSYCATCDGAFFRKKVTAVIGGGDVAIEDAIFLSRLCEKVYLIHRRDELRGAKSLQKQLFSQRNVEVIWDTVAESIEGDQKVTTLKIQNRKTGESGELSVDGVFIAVGITPNSQEFKGFAEMDQSGYIVAGEDGKTSVPGVFAAGDVRTKRLRQIVTAVADGANCISSVEEYLSGR